MLDFIGEIPKESGYYWYVDKEYPMPVIGFVMTSKFYTNRGHDVTQFIGTHIFIGPIIPSPLCTEVNIVE